MWSILLACLAAVPGNLLQNPGVDQLTEGQPTGWGVIDFKTGGTGVYDASQGHDGPGYLVAKSANDQQRVCWFQKVAIPAGTEGVLFGGWYRNRNLLPDSHRGPSIRIHFHRQLDAWDELSLQQVFYRPMGDWTEVSGGFFVPEGTVAVVIEAFQWLVTGETHWDDLWLKTCSAAEVPIMPLDVDQAVDRAPVDGRNLRYSPADGSRPDVNPPPFLWLPSGRERTYRLEIGRDAALQGDGTIRREGLVWCAEMLHEPLAAGTWFWRYGVEMGHGQVTWSKVRRFEVTASATPWAYPKPDAFQVSEQRPRLFITAAELPSYRQRAREGDLKEAAAALLRDVAKWTGEDLVPEPEFLPKDPVEKGWAYTKTFRETRPPMDRMETAALAYLLTGDEAAGDEAKRRILHFFAWDPMGSTDVFHNDEPAMWVMMRGTRAYDWTWDRFTPAERAKVEAAMKVRASQFYKQLSSMPFENSPFSSHPGRTIGFLGEASLSFLPDWPEAQTWLDYITRIYWGVYPAWGKEDGGWNEGPGYWSAYMSFGLHFVVALKNATGIDLSQRPFFHQTPYFRLYLTPPYSQMAPFGDGTQFKPSNAGSLLYWFSTLDQDPVIRWYADEQNSEGGNGILGVVLQDDDIKGQPPTELPQSRLFDGVGLATLHTDLAHGDNNVEFAMRSTPYGAVSHGHNDQNCFVLEAYGEPLAIATGYYPKYGSPHHDQWTRSTKAKCGITIDGGEGQDRGWQAKGAITDFVYGSAFDVVVGDATKAYGGRLTKAVRQVVHVRPGLFVMRDDLASETPRAFEYQLHALDEMAVDTATRTVTTTRPKATMTTQFLRPRQLAFSQHDQYLPPPETKLRDAYQELTWHLTASTAEQVKETEFLTVLLPAKAGEEASRPAVRELTVRGGTGVELTFADGSRTMVLFRSLQPAVEADGLASDGTIAAIRLDPSGTPTGWLMATGTTLSWNGKELVKADQPMTVTADLPAKRVDVSGEGGSLSLPGIVKPQTVPAGRHRL